MTTRQTKILLTFSGIVVNLFFVLHSASAAMIYISPSSGSYTIGQSITVTARINSSGSPINASEGTITWTKDALQFVSVSAGGSIFKYWPVDPAVRGNNSVIFSGGLPSPGYNGSAGTILKITFTAKAAGTGTVQVSGAKVLANDGQGTDVYTGSGTASLVIGAATKPTPAPVTPSVPTRPTPSISSSSHPDQSVWYHDPVAQVTWTKPSGAEGFSYSLTADANTTPDESVDTSGTSTTVTLADDGTWYVHVRAKYSTGWSNTAHFALRLDRTPPKEFTPVVEQDRGPSDPSPTLTFTTTDSPSGIAKYTYSIDGGKAVEATSPVDLSGISAGQHTIVVTAYDHGGTTREGKVTFSTEGYAAPTIRSVSSPLILLDPLVVRGTAAAGDTVSIYVGSQLVGQAVVGPADQGDSLGASVRIPWTVTVERLFRPGSYVVTATATSASGQVSTKTDDRTMHVIGRSLFLNGRPVATISVATPVGVLVLSLLALIIAIMARLVVAVMMMHRRERNVEEELETLRDLNKRQSISRQQLDDALEQIEEDVEGGGAPAKRKVQRRRAKKRSR